MENYKLPVPLAASNWRLREALGDQLERGRLITQTFTLGQKLAFEDPAFGILVNNLTLDLSGLDGQGRFPASGN